MSSSAVSSAVKVPTFQLEIHLLGGGRGESILLRFPDGTWGVIDCCSSVSGPQPDARNETLSFLETRNVTELEFLCLTHPHSDHYRGMSALLERFRVKRFWGFARFPQEGTRFLIASAQASLSVPPGPISDALDAVIRRRWADVEELRSIRETIIRRVRAQQISVNTVEAHKGLYQRDYQLENGNEVAVLKIEGLTPVLQDVVSYYEPIQEWFGGAGSLTVPSPPDHNAISGALRITFGETMIILGADATERLWINLFNSDLPAEVAAQVVKVSHHGSRNAAPEDLWHRIADEENNLCALIAPFATCNLPQPDMVAFFLRYADRVLVTAESPSSDTEENDDVINLFAATAGVTAVRPEPRIATGHGGTVIVDSARRILELRSQGARSRIYQREA